MEKDWTGKMILVRPHDPVWDGKRWDGKRHKEGRCPICDGFLTSHDGMVLETHRPSAYIILPDGVGEPSELPRGVMAVHLDGWNASYHDPYFFPSANRTVLFVVGKKPGRLGRLRKAYKAAMEERALPRGRHPETGKTIAIRKGIYRGEGD